MNKLKTLIKTYPHIIDILIIILFASLDVMTVYLNKSKSK